MFRVSALAALFVLFLTCFSYVQAETAPDSPPTEPPDQILSPGQGKKPAASSARNILSVSLNGPVYERMTVPPFLFSTARPVELFSLFKVLQRAKSDPSVTGILLRIGTLGAGWGKCQELRDLIQDFRTSGKKVWAWLPFGTNREYFVASAADEVIMPPAGLLLVMGLRAEVTFLKGLLDKIGVEAEIIHVGAYKGSGEPYMRTEMSPEFRETVENLVDDVMTTYVLGVSKSLRMEAMAFEKLLDDGPFHAPEAQKRKLIARTAYLDEFVDEISEKGKVKLLSDSKYAGDGLDRPDFSTLPGFLSFLSQLTAPPVTSRSPNPKLALIYAVGPILNESVSGLPGADDIITAAPLVKAFDSARKDPTVKAVILRVDSPGGDIITSDLIWRAVEKTDKVKPVVVSMSDVAASGGYYVSMPARAIVAHRATITGSIGVLGGKFNLEKLYGLVGAKVEIVERGRGSGLFSAHHKLTDEERQRLYNLLKQSYDLFLDKVSQGRKDKVKDINGAAEGRAWTGGRAFEIGLVDALGGLREAFNRAKQLAGMKPEDKLDLMVFPRQKTLFDLLGGEAEDAKSALPAALIPAPLKPEMWRDFSVLFMLAERKVLAHTPCRIEVR
jgi:protease-4